MIKFDDGEITRLLRKKKLGVNACYVLFALLLICAVLAAVLARGAYSDDVQFGNHIYALAFAAVCLAALIAVWAIVVIPAGRALKLKVNSALAHGLLLREDMFKGGGEIEFEASYKGDVLTLSRKGYTGEITIDPTRLKGGENLGGKGAAVEIDLSPLKAVPALYATLGTRLWLFLQAFYFLHGEKNGVKSVKIFDNMGKSPCALQVFTAGAPAEKAAENYFIEKGLVK
ncbi:MAG: hypothetical protein NC131_05530 [Roseburia sp.]|nr:hypothetical protein [Roseburia sp.]